MSTNSGPPCTMYVQPPFTVQFRCHDVTLALATSCCTGKINLRVANIFYYYFKYILDYIIPPNSSMTTRYINFIATLLVLLLVLDQLQTKVPSFAVVMLLNPMMEERRMPPPAAATNATAAVSSPSGGASSVSPPSSGADKRHHCLNDDFEPSPNKDVAVAIYLNSNSPAYMKGGIQIGKSLKRGRTKTPVDLIAIESHDLPMNTSSPEYRELLAGGWKRCVVGPIVPPTKARLWEKFAFLHLWAFTNYRTIVYMDSDTYPTSNGIDDLIRMDMQGKKLGATRDILGRDWVKTFNAGVLLFYPSAAEYERLIGLLEGGIKYDYIRGDQGFLNEVYKDGWHEIGFVNNANLALYVEKREFWDQHNQSDINIIHYTVSKPWNCDLKKRLGPICKIWHEYD